MTTPTGVRHDPQRGRFELDVDGETAHVEYRQEGDTMVVLHTIVPDALAGRGIAGTLNAAALDHARDAGMRVDPQCEYTASYVRRHPGYADLVRGADRSS
ncbi:N-acetyltransferase [Luteimonas yindakuii]|uniref:GNAT family N-acetyltransferase n=1 Tax=Luteimonas yindakuii TaxID=2565782 RepID=UPI0010A543F7|nr:GNAT family N-acetyltransferase [Luteimonas yindakuii]QCO67511.1 N-acetyltransferase [Luteimonas yindakuii]